MMLTKGAIGNLINRYSAVLKKCSLMNTFGSLAVAGMLVAGGVSGAWAEGTTPAGWDNTHVVANDTTLSGTYQGFAQTDRTLAGVATVDYVTTGVSVANNAKFINNSMTVGSAGGALKLLNGITIGQNVEFSGNKATEGAWGGGAIYIKLANGMTASATQTVTIDENAIFKGNIATSLGGAIALEYGQLEIKKGASFTNNSATAGGAIAVWTDTKDHAYNTTTNTLTLTDATFTSNTAGTNGGAVFLAGAGTNTFTNTTFEGNQALGENGKGGAVYMAGGALTVENVVFKDNRAEPGNSMGGAVALGHDGNITSASFKDSSFIGNRATGAGGAISFANTAATTADNQKILTLTNIDFKNNTSAGVGGAIRNYLGIVKFDITKDMTYSGNTAGLNSDGTFGKLYTDYGGFLNLQGGNPTNPTYASKAEFNVTADKTLTIGEESTKGSAVDSIASAHGTGTTITKSGTGTLTVNGSMKAYTGAIEVKEGTLNMATGFGEVSNGIQYRVNAGKTGPAAVAGFAASEMTIADGANVNMGDLDITFSTFTNNNPTNTSLGNVGTKVSVQTNGSFKAGAVNVTKKTYTGAGEKNEQTVTTAGWGEFNIAESAKATIDSLTVDAGTQFDKTGAGKLDVTGKVDVTGALNISNGQLAIGGDMTVNEFTTGTDGKVTLGDTGSLYIAGDLNSSKGYIDIAHVNSALTVLGTYTTGGKLADGTRTVELSKGSVTVGALNLVDAEGYNTSSNKVLTVSGGTATVLGLDADKSFFTGTALTVNGGALNFGTAADTKVAGQTLVTQGGTTSAAVTVSGSGKLNVVKGDWTTGALTQTGGTVAVNGGNLTVASLTQTGTGKITVGGSSGKAQLTVTGNFQNVAYNSSKNEGVDIQNLGTLSVKSDVVTKGTGTTYALKADANEINVAAGGTVKLGFDENTTLTTDNLGEIKKALATNFAGLLDVGNATIKVTTAEDNTVAYSDVQGVTSDNLKETTVKVNTSAAGSGVSGGFKDIVVSDDKVTEVKVTNTLVLAGSSDGGNLLQNSNNTVLRATVADNSALTLGVEDKANSGTVGAVNLGSSSALNAIGSGSFTVDRITTTASGGSGIVSASAGSSLTVTGTIGNSSNYLSEVKAEGGNISVGEALHAATVTATGGNVAAKLVSTTIVKLDKGGSLITDEIKMNGTSAAITVGSTDGGAGTLIAKTADLNGASLFLDPAWIEGQEYQDAALASRAAFEAFGTSGINGKITVGENSQLSLGTADVNWLTKSITDMGSSVWGAKGITAALGIYSPQTLDATNGGIVVDGSLKVKADVTNKAEFRANSLLVVNAPNMLKKAALVGDGTASTLTVDKDAKLHIMGGKANDTVKIVSGFTAGSTIGGWSTNLTTDSKLLTANAGTLISGAYDVTLSQNSTRSIFPKLDKNMAGLVDGMVKQIGLDPMSENYGQRFVSRAVSDSYIGTTNAKKAAATIEGAAKIAFAGAAPQIGMNLANAAGNIAGLRNSLSAAPQGAVVALNADGTSAQEGLSAGDGMKNGLGLWVMSTYQNQQGFGFESGDFETGYKSNAAGVALGADYTFNDMFRVGAQFNVGGGYAESTGDFNSTDNRFNYWGLGLYAGYQYQNFGLTADFGYSANNNELEQSLPSAMQMAKLKADAKTDTITAGLRGEYKITTDALDIVPHLGVRMTNMHMDSFNVKSDKHKVFKADDMNATVWTFPVGVTFSKDIETSNGWTIKPLLDLAIIPAAGDIEAKQDVKIAGVNGTASMESNIMDAISYQGSLGLSVKNDNGVSVGVNYTLQAGAHTTDHGVQAAFRYEF